MINTEYRIVELHRMFSIEVKKGKEWGDLNLYGVPRFFDSLADARSWVTTIKRGVVYHDAEEPSEVKSEQDMVVRIGENGICPITGKHCDDETCATESECNVSGRDVIKDAPNLAQDERKAEKGNVIWDEWEEALARNIVRLLMARGTVNGITIHNVSIDDEYIRITT
jgi:hypothetical protein